MSKRTSWDVKAIFRATHETINRHWAGTELLNQKAGYKQRCVDADRSTKCIDMLQSIVSTWVETVDCCGALFSWGADTWGMWPDDGCVIEVETGACPRRAHTQDVCHAHAQFTPVILINAPAPMQAPMDKKTQASRNLSSRNENSTIFHELIT